MFVRLLLVFTILIALGIAIFSSMSNLTSSAAQMATSAALMTSQCLTGFLMVVSLATGVVFGVGLGMLRHNSSQIPAPTDRPRWVSGPNAHWQRLDAPAQRQFPLYHNQLPEYQQVLVVSDEEESDFSMQGWGF
jgi:hypothetical protein